MVSIRQELKMVHYSVIFSTSSTRKKDMETRKWISVIWCMKIHFVEISFDSFRQVKERLQGACPNPPKITLFFYSIF